MIILIAGIWAGAINSVVGSGTLVTFPVLVALGYPPLTATTSNAIGVAPGSVSGAMGYRHELKGFGPQLARLSVASFFGAICGTVLLLSLPPNAFESFLPLLVGLAVALVAVQPKVSGWIAERRAADGVKEADHPGITPLLLFFTFLIGVYGGYFTAAQGVLMMGVMGMMLSEPLQRLNGVRNVLSALVNVVAGTIYAFGAPINWSVVALLAVGSTLGGQLGAKIGLKLKPAVLRGVIVAVGVGAMVHLVTK